VPFSVIKSHERILYKDIRRLRANLFANWLGPTLCRLPDDGVTAIRAFATLPDRCGARPLDAMIPGSALPPKTRLLAQERWARPRYFRARISINRETVRSDSAEPSAFENISGNSAWADKTSFTRRS
jgi:hypothetical protein